MLRAAVATYLVIVTAAGPLFCCCTPRRLSALLLRPSAAPVSAACPGCCCGHHKSPEQPAPPDGPESPQPSQPPCPCQDGPLCTVDLPSASEITRPDAAPSDGATTPVPVHATAGALPCCSTLTALGARRAHPVLTADDLLRVHHMLRC
jgi:hypothetical protein